MVKIAQYIGLDLDVICRHDHVRPKRERLHAGRIGLILNWINGQNLSNGQKGQKVMKYKLDNFISQCVGFPLCH